MDLKHRTCKEHTSGSDLDQVENASITETETLVKSFTV